MKETQLEQIKLKDFEDIKKDVEEKHITDITIQVKELLEVKEQIEEAIKDIKAEYDGYVKPGRSYMREIDVVIAEAKTKALEYAQQTYREKTIINKNTGEVEVKKITDLPKGFSLVSGKQSPVFDETKIPDKYFDRVLNKKRLDAAIKAGEIDFFEILDHYEQADNYVSITKSKIAGYLND